MKNKATAVIDIDGVLADFEQKFCEDFGSKNRHLYDLRDRYPQYDRNLIAEWVNLEDNYLNLSPIFGGILLIQQLKDRGFDVVLMTSRGKHLEAVTKSWLTLYHIETKGLVFTQDKADEIWAQNTYWEKFAREGEKVSPVTVFVDDSVSQLEQVKKLNPSVTCLAWGQTYNMGWYPRLRYNGANYKIEAHTGTGDWKHIWEK